MAASIARVESTSIHTVSVEIERAVGNCETAAQRRAFLAEMRDGGDNFDGFAYLASCARHPEIMIEVPETPQGADWRYTGPWLSPWDVRQQKRVLARDEHGAPISVRSAQQERFGVGWRRTWQDASRAGDEEDDALCLVGPKDEVVCVAAPPPVGSSWEEVSEAQVSAKSEYVRAKHPESELVRFVRDVLRRLRGKFAVASIRAGKNDAASSSVGGNSAGSSLAKVRLGKGKRRL